MKHLKFAIIGILLSGLAAAEDHLKIKVFVALCDNETQGIAKVGARIGDGNKPDENLYWGCSDGFQKIFPRSESWELAEEAEDVAEGVLRRMKLRHAKTGARIVADAYRGARIKECTADFELAAVSGEYDLVAFIGHNGLMDFQLEEPPLSKSGTDAIVLACLSDKYFSARLRQLGVRPILMTRQLMYPGSFILRDVIESWIAGGELPDLRVVAGKAYAKNQKISEKAATGIFAILE